MVAADDKVVVGFPLSGGNAHDAPMGRGLLKKVGPTDRPAPLLMDRAYEGDRTRRVAESPGYVPVVPPKRSRRNPWGYDKELYKKRNEVERFFRRARRFRRVSTRYDKLDRMFLMFFTLALICDLLA